MPEWLMQLIIVIVPSGGLITAFLLWRQDRRRGPIEYRTAALAESSAVAKAATELVGVLNSRLSEVNARMAQQDARIDKQDARIAEQGLEIFALKKENDSKNRILLIWDDWYDDLEEGWHEHRTRETPPASPVQR